MIDLDVRVTGAHIGEKLAQDEEECAYALVEIFENLGDRGMTEVAEHLHGQGSIVVFLRDLANKIEDLE